MMRAGIAAGLLAVAGCSPAPQQARETQQDAASDDANIAAELGAAAPSHDDPAPAATASPDGAAARFVGRWAAKAELCRDGAWVFGEKHLATAGEVSCDFNRVTHVADGYDVAASCLAEGTTSHETIKLRFPSKDAMLVGSKTFAPVGLKRCPA